MALDQKIKRAEQMKAWRKANPHYKERALKRYYENHEAELARSKKYHSTPDRRIKDKNNKLKRDFGITIDDYNRMFDEQNGSCKMCNTHQSKLEDSLCVDHCHSTGVVRGLLCHGCNKGLGFFEKFKFAAEKYLEESKNNRD